MLILSQLEIEMCGSYVNQLVSRQLEVNDDPLSPQGSSYNHLHQLACLTNSCLPTEACALYVYNNFNCVSIAQTHP